MTDIDQENVNSGSPASIPGIFKVGWFTAIVVYLLLLIACYFLFPVPEIPRTNMFMRIAGQLLLTAIALTIPLFNIYFFHRELMNRRSLLVLQGIIILLFLVNLAVVQSQVLNKAFIDGIHPEFLVFTPLFCILLSVLINRNVAFATLISMSLIIIITTTFSAMAMLGALVAGFAAIISSRQIRKRSSFTFQNILWITVSYAAVALGHDLMTEPLRWVMGLDVGLGFINGLASTVLFIGVLPLAEALFGITTDWTLLELSDMNHPLLKRLTLEAPGTFHHSLIVSAMAEAGADVIGANGLLARVGAYFHDVGKISAPQYFVENQEEINPHDALSPEESAAKIRAHVEQGIKLARKHRIPKVVADFIPMHHGDNVMLYFYDKAKKLRDDAGDLPVDAFRHSGPKPDTRETSIVQLADAVESSTRTLENPTPEEMREFVDNLVSKKIVAGDLDLCPMTLDEIRRVIGAFMPVLQARGHHRIKYPSQDKPIKI